MPNKIFNRPLYRRQLRKGMQYVNSLASAGRVIDNRLLDHIIDQCIFTISDMTKKFESVLMYGHWYINQGMQRQMKLEDGQREHHLVISNAVGNSLKSLEIDPLKQAAASVIFDEELMPFQNNMFNLVISNLSLNFTNDFVSVLASYKAALKDGGLLIINIVGGASLHNLRDAMAYADLYCHNGIGNRIAPMLQPAILANCAQNCGFSSVMVEREVLAYRFQDWTTMLEILRYWGQGGCMIGEELAFCGEFRCKVEEYYMMISKEDGGIWDEFEILTLFAVK